MGLHIGGRGSNVKLLYQDETYSIWDEKTSAYILLTIKPWHLSIGFYYEEWERLKKIVADIQSSEILTGDIVILYTDELYIFGANDKTVSWHLRNRQITLTFDHGDWEGFRTVILGPDTIAWTVVWRHRMLLLYLEIGNILFQTLFRKMRKWDAIDLGCRAVQFSRRAPVQ